MGAWDVGIFDNDTSADVRAFYEDFLREDEATATARVLERFAEDVDEPEVAPDVWFALAGTQWELGRLEPDVRDRALALIESGEDLQRWRDLDADEEDVRARGEALAEFASQLRSPPGPPRIPEPLPPLPVSRFAVGDILTYELPSGRFVVLFVIKAAAGTHVCTFVPEALPSRPTVEETMTLDIAEDPHEAEPAAFRAWMLEFGAEEDDRVQVLGNVPFDVDPPGHLQRLSWAELPAYLERHLGLA